MGWEFTKCVVRLLHKHDKPKFDFLVSLQRLVVSWTFTPLWSPCLADGWLIVNEQMCRCLCVIVHSTQCVQDSSESVGGDVFPPGPLACSITGTGEFMAT